MTDGDWKVTVAGTDYTNDVFTDVQVKGRENGIMSAALTASNYRGAMWNDTLSLFDNIKVSIEDGGSFVEIFDGYLLDYAATVTHRGALATIKCKGLGNALAVTHCKDNFGYTSDQEGLDTIEEILEDLVDNSVNLSYSSANATGYSIGKNYIQAIDAAYSIPFLNLPYQACHDIVNLICRLDTAYRDGSTAGPHWFVDVSGNLRIKTIGTQQAHGGFGGGDWGIYYGGSNTAVALTEGVDFIDYVLTKPANNYANSVVAVCDLRKPAYDYWTEDSGGAALWANDALTSITDDNSADVDPGADTTPAYVVGSHGLTLDPNGANTGYAVFPGTSLSGDAAAGQKNVSVTSATHFQVGDVCTIWDTTPDIENCTIDSIAGTTLTMTANLGNAYTVAASAAISKHLEWDTQTMGSKRSIPTIEFYSLHYNLTTATTHIYLSTNDTSRKTDYFYATFLDWSSDPNYSWTYHSIPIGYYASKALAATSREQCWRYTGTPDWSDIDSIEFMIAGAGANGFLIIDDLHISGRIIREAVDTSEVTANNEYQHAILSRTPLDDTLVAADDTGMAASIAYAELLRRVTPPRNLICTVPLQVNLKPGEYYSIYCGKTASSYKINGVDFRVTEYTHTLNQQGRTTQLKLSDDVLNSFPLTALDARVTLNEYLLEKNAKAKDMQGGEIDILVNHLRKAY